MDEDTCVVVPVERFWQPVLDKIRKITGKQISVEKFRSMDSTRIGKILGLAREPPLKIRRGDEWSYVYI